MHEAGCDLIVTPYRGRAVEAPWWRTAPNPCYREGELFARLRGVAAKVKGDTHLRRAEEHPPDTAADRLVRETVWRWVTPRWQRHLERILARGRDGAAVGGFTVATSHPRGAPSALRARFSGPRVVYYGAGPTTLARDRGV